jgi:hypothetical protein
VDRRVPTEVDGADGTLAEIVRPEDQQVGESLVDFKKRTRAAYVVRRRAEMEARDEAAPIVRRNPLMMLDEERSSRLFMWLRECPYQDAVKQMLAEQGIPDVTDAELNEFFQSEANSHWQRRLQRAATEANALVGQMEAHPTRFSRGILVALGQEAFRQIASGDLAPESMTRIVNLFLKARGDERADEALELRREKLRRDWHDQTEKALEAFAREIEKHPEARAAFEALRLELLRKEES